MDILVAFIGYFFLFLGICGFVVLGFAFNNILTKSYNSHSAIAIVLFLSTLFLMNSLLLYFSYSQLSTNLRVSNFNFGIFSTSKSGSTF
jgi:hypothetical protein